MQLFLPFSFSKTLKHERRPKTSVTRPTRELGIQTEICCWKRQQVIVQVILFHIFYSCLRFCDFCSNTRAYSFVDIILFSFIVERQIVVYLQSKQWSERVLWFPPSLLMMMVTDGHGWKQDINETSRSFSRGLLSFISLRRTRREQVYNSCTRATKSTERRVGGVGSWSWKRYVMHSFEGMKEATNKKYTQNQDTKRETFSPQDKHTKTSLSFLFSWGRKRVIKPCNPVSRT